MATTVTTVAVYGGDSLRLEYRFKDDADAAVDVSGYTFTAQWRSDSSSSTAVAFTVNQTAAATGVIVLTMTGTQTASMLRSGQFDLQGTQGSEVRTFLKGSTVWTADVTRA